MRDRGQSEFHLGDLSQPESGKSTKTISRNDDEEIVEDHFNGDTAIHFFSFEERLIRDKRRNHIDRMVKCLINVSL